VPLHVSASTIRPLLKWAGGKRQLLHSLGAHYPASFTRYIEPFLGSGAVFFHLSEQRQLADRCVLLADVNADLIGCYRAVRDHADDVIAELAALEREHRMHGDLCYYDVRDKRFNPLRAALPRRAASDGYPPALAAMFIFLNRTGFNGLFRLNRAGSFNVPAGRYARPRICDPDHIRRIAGILETGDIAIELQPFDVTLAEAGEGDFVYCDPPYAPLSPTASFAQYTADGFNGLDQRRLQETIVAACRRGAQVVLSNSSAPGIMKLYSEPAAVRAGLRIVRVPARRAINSRASARGPVDELIVTNVKMARETAAPVRPQTRPARPTMLKMGSARRGRKTA
jgi:DNA adenine methylase